MGRNKRKFRPVAGKTKTATKPSKDELSDDEVDEFFNSRMQGPEQDGNSSSDDMSDLEQNAVLNVDDPNEVSSDDSSSSSDDETPYAARKNKNKTSDKEIDKIGSKWGSKRQNFFKEGESSSDEEGESDDETAENEREARRMKKQLLSGVKASHYALEDDSDDDDGDDGATTRTKSKSKTKGKQNSTAKSTENLERVAAQAPELFGLLCEFKQNLETLENHVTPVLAKVRDGKLPTEDGVTYLEAKYQAMLTYCINIAYYLYLKAQGKSVRDHPVIGELVRVRTILDKLKPLDTKLKNQMDEIISGTTLSIKAKPNLKDLVSSDSEAEDASSSEEEDRSARKPLDKGKYVVPKGSLAPAMFHEDEREMDLYDKKQAKLKEKLKKSRMLQELTSEFSERPLEMPSIGSTMEDAKNREILEERRRYEEENFVRLRETKKQKAERRRRERDAQSGLETSLAEMEDFGDLDGLVQRVDRDASRRIDEKARRRQDLAQFMNKIDQQERANRSKTMRSGDEDLKIKDPFAMEHNTRNQNLHNHSEDDGDDEEDILKRKLRDVEENTRVDSDDEDEMYRVSKQASKKKRKERKDLYTFPARQHPSNITLVKPGEKRTASRKILKNEGLKPHKRKDDKNPRVKRRKKYEKSLKRRQGQVQKIRDSKEGAGYGGEATGIRTNIVASRRPNKF